MGCGSHQRPFPCPGRVQGANLPKGNAMENNALLEPIRVRYYGNSGPQVVLLHGGPGAPGSLAPLARRLGERFRVMEPLQRTSGGPALTVVRHEMDLREVLQPQLSEGPISLVGFSWGAMLALTYAARHPADVDRVVLIGCGTFDSLSRATYQVCMEQHTSAATRMRLSTLGAELSARKNPVRRNELFAEFGKIYTRLQAFNPVAAEAESVCCDEAGFNETWKDVLSLQEQGIQPAEFVGISAPVTMIHGDEDPHPGPLIHDSLAPFIRNLKYLGLARCGHTPWIEKEAGDHFHKILTQCLGQDHAHAII